MKLRSDMRTAALRCGRGSMLRSLAPAAIAILAGGCAKVEGVQSALDPATPDAERVVTLTWILWIGGTAILVLVMGLLLVAITTRPERRRWLAGRATIVIGGLAFPIVTLFALLVYGLAVLAEVHVPQEDSLRIEVVGEQYWWRVRYPAENGRPGFETANEIVLPTGRPITFLLSSADVIHSFWVPRLGGKQDMIPGRINDLAVTIDQPGVYRGQCAEFCGQQHTWMAFTVRALEPAAFEAWREREAAPATVAAGDLAERGRALFVSSGCGSCHTVRGTASAGRAGPDLTHVGSRTTIGAGLLPNNVGTLAGWVSDVQHLKEGARMPSYGSYTGQELRAIAHYLETLK